jgi:hypothetical protein
MLLHELDSFRWIVDRLDAIPPNGRRSLVEDLKRARENVELQESKLRQLEEGGDVIFDNKPTVHLDRWGIYSNDAFGAQSQQLHLLSSEEMQQTGSRTIEAASSAGTGAAPGAGEAAAPSAGDAASAGAGEAASAGSRSRLRSRSTSVQVDGQPPRRWRQQKPITQPRQLESSTSTSSQRTERAAKAIPLPRMAPAKLELKPNMGARKAASSTIAPMRTPARGVLPTLQDGAWIPVKNGWLTARAEPTSAEEFVSWGADVVVSLQERSAGTGSAHRIVSASAFAMENQHLVYPIKPSAINPSSATLI